MTFTCESAVLSKALRDIVTIVPRGEAMPILSNVLIEASDGKVRVTTTNLEMMATRSFAAEVDNEMSITVDANRFSSVVAALAEGSQAKVSLADAGGASPQLTVAAGRSRFRFGTIPASHFPPMPFEVGDGVEFEAGDDFLSAIATVRHASATELPAPGMIGVCLENSADGFAAVATNGKRLAAAHISEKPDAMFKVNMPAALADMVTKLGADTSRAVLARISDKAAQFDFGDTILTGKMLIDPFPIWRRILPASSSRVIRVHGPAVLQALRRIALLTDDKAKRIYITLEPGKLTMANDGRDKATEEVPCDFDGEPLTIWFSNPFLREAVSALNADEMTIALNGSRDPALLTSPSREGIALIVMPQFEGGSVQ